LEILKTGNKATIFRVLRLRLRGIRVL